MHLLGEKIAVHTFMKKMLFVRQMVFDRLVLLKRISMSFFKVLIV